MANLLNGIEIPNPHFKPAPAGNLLPLYLDTLEHVDQSLQANDIQEDIRPLYITDKTLYNKARNKFFTNHICYHLEQLQSPLKNSYSYTRFRCMKDMTQEGVKVVTEYCRHRWCNNCNRIRTMKLMNGYSKPLSLMKEPRHVVLTIVNVSGAELRSTIKQMQKNSTNILRRLKYLNKKERKDIINAIRKIETTYNLYEDTYHPHFHFIIDGYDNAERLIDEWLNTYPSSTRINQKNIEIKNAKGLIEVFKYTTKMATTIKKENDKKETMICIPALDTIFQAMSGLRTFQTFGNIKKVSEDIDGIKSQEYKIPYYEFAVLKYIPQMNDWQRMIDGSMLTNFKATKKEINFVTNNIIH